VTLRFATFNIRNCQADDGVNSWPYRVHHLQTFVQDLDADILGFQEVLHPQLLALQDALPNYRFVGVGRIDGAEQGEFVPIFYRVGTVVDQGCFWLSETPDVPGSTAWDTACERMCTWMDLEVSGQIIRVLNTHLDHVSELARLEGARLIAGKAGQATTVIMGDFNTKPGSPPVEELEDYGFRGATPRVEMDTFHGWGKHSGGQIDHLMCRGATWSDAEIIVAKVDGEWVSDHNAVRATLTLK